MANEKLGTLSIAINLDDSDLNKTLKEAKMGLQRAANEFKTTTAAVKNMDNGLEGLKKESESLMKVMYQQKLTNRELLKEMEALKKDGVQETSKEYQKLESQFYKNATAMQKNETAYKQLQNKMETYEKEAKDAKTDTKNLGNQMTTTSNQAKSMGESVKGSFVGIKNAAGKVVLAVAAIKTAIETIGVAQKGINKNASMETSLISWETILKNADKAKQTLKDLEKMSAETPFEFPELDKSAKMLHMAKIEGYDLFESLRIVGDAVSAIGGSSEVMDGISLALFQVSTKGKLQAEEANQFAERGIPIWEILAEKMGKTTAELMDMGRDGELVAKEVIPLLLEGLNERFNGAMGRMSETFTGLKSTFDDMLNIIAGQITKPLFDQLKKGLEKAVELSERFSKAFEKGGWKEALKEFFSPEVAKIINGMRENIGKLKEHFSAMFEVISGRPGYKLYELWGDKRAWKFVQIVEKIKNFIGDTYNTISGIFSVFKGEGAGNLSKVFDEKKIEKFMKVVEKLKQNIDDYKLVFKDTFNQIRDAFTKALGKEGAKPLFTKDGFLGFITELVDLWAESIPKITEYIEEITPLLVEIGTEMGEMVKQSREFWKENGDEIMKGILGLVKFIFDAWIWVQTNVIPVIQFIWELISGIWKSNQKTILGLIQVFVGLFTGDFSKMKEGVILIVQGMLDRMVAVFSGLWALISGHLTNVKEGIEDTFDIDLYQLGMDMIQGLVDGIKKKMPDLYKKLTEIGESIPLPIKRALLIKSPSRVMAKEVGAHIPSGIAMGIKNNMSVLKTAVKDMGSATISTVGGASIGTNVSNTTNFQPNVNIYANDPFSTAIQQRRLFSRMRFEGGLT